MGSWGPGIFQNDTALDLLGDLGDQMITEARAIEREDFDIDDLKLVLASIAILTTFYERFGGGIPDDVDAAMWEQRCIQAFDDGAEGYFRDEEARSAHRRVLVDTLQRFKEFINPARPRMDL